MFTKSTDTHQYLRAASRQRLVHKKSIPYGQAIQMKRICSNVVDLQRKLFDLESWWTEVQKVNLIDRNNLKNVQNIRRIVVLPWY